MSSPIQDAPEQAPNHATTYAPGLMVKVCDELWLITSVTQSVDGYLLKVRGLSDYVRDTTASFYTAIDDVEVVPDRSPGYRTTRLWLETTLRQTPVPLYQEQLSVADQMLMDPLDYQLTAVRKALSDDNLRPRVLIADAVGLGKTLEIGMILSELIRRGRGERILVVTPKHIMEQFQQELWSRFAIPLVRLDSTGIQRVRQMLPASRNPFTYFPRVIVSMDTIIDDVKLSNDALTRVLQNLLLSKVSAGKDRGFISYATLGVTELGQVYEGLMSYHGFIA